MADYENYEIIEIERDKISNAPYNPRVIKDSAKKKLKENIKTVGLLAPIIWNETTGNIVSGHQRISVLDSLNKNKKYKIKVAKVKLDEKTEKEQNIFLNNSRAQGEFDFDKLSEMYNDGVSFESAGFDNHEIMTFFDPEMDKMNDQQIQEIANKIKENQANKKKIKNKATQKNDVNFYVVFVFRDKYNRDNFLDNAGLDRDVFQDGSKIEELLTNGN
jgi:hypothetical protein